jgi:hypothetical protein
MDETTRAQLVERYKLGPDVVERALAGIIDAELDARPGDGEWTAREIVHHLADSEMTSARRTTGEILDRLTEEQWARTGHHTQSGVYGVETWLEIYAAHANDHADQIARCRGQARRGS